jgi:hypothetical protein
MWCSGSYKHIYLRGRGFESREWKCEWALQGGGGNGNELCSEDGMRMTEHGMKQPTPYRR